MVRSDIDWSSRQGSNLIDLGEQGLSPGDDLGAYVDQYLDSGNQVYIPPGEYFMNAHDLAGTYANCSLVGDPEGVVYNRPSPETTVEPTITPSGGDVLIENMTCHGQKGQRQSNWRVDCEGGDLTLRNVNFPDGSKDCSDSQFLYGGSGTGPGTVYLENCYVAGHGNSLVYFTYTDDVHVVVDGCTFANSNTQMRPGVAGATVRNTQFFGDGFVPRWSGDDPTDGNCGGSINRPFRIDTPCRIEVENVHWIQTTECSSPGSFMTFKEHTTGYIDGAFLYNETGADPVSGASNADLSTSNIHISGSGDTSLPWSVSGSQMPDTEKTIWTPVQDASPCESDDECPRGRVCDGGDCVPPVFEVDGDQSLPVLASERNFETEIRTVHGGYSGDGFIDIEPRDGGFAIWHLDVKEAGEYGLDIRFSNGSGNDRTCDLIVGDRRDRITFPDTGGWESWDTMVATVDLPAGQYEFGFEATGDDTGQIDNVDLLAPDPCRGVECGSNEVCIDGDCIPENEAPTSDFSTEVDGLHVTVHPDASDPDDNIVDYEVDWGDGTVTDQPSPVSQAHTYDASGDYTIMLTVTDAGGLSHSRTRTVTVEEPGPCDGVDCPSGEECVNGECVPVDDGGGGIGTVGMLLGLAAAGGWVMYQQSQDDK